jgi:DNA polymerase-3 subunit beta
VKAAMKIIIERAALVRALGHVQSVVEKRNTIPVLSNVLIKAKNGAVEFIATDMEIEILETVPADVQEEGSITAPAVKLFEISRKLPDGAQIQLTSTENDSVLQVHSGKSNFKLGCLPTADFPLMTVEDNGHKLDLPSQTLKTLIDSTKFSMSAEETRFYLNGIYFHTLENNGKKILRTVATDGHRLAQAQFELEGDGVDIPGVILPRKTVLELCKLIDNAADVIHISISETKAQFSFDTIELRSKLIDGTFPDYEKVIPKGNNKALRVNAEQFAKAVDRVATLSNEKSKAIKLNISSGQMTLSATSTDAGSAIEELDIDYKDDAIEVGFNAKYVLDIAQQIKGKEVQLDFSDASAPTILKEIKGDNALYVLMPMRV